MRKPATPFESCPRSIRLVILSGLLLASAAPLAFAAASADSARAPDGRPIVSLPAPFDTLRVTASRLHRRAQMARLSSFAEWISVEDERGPAEAVANVLSRSTGLSIQRYGGPGALSLLSIRGADPGEVQVFLDRTPLRGAARGVVDLGAIGLSSIESIEIYRSVPPTDLGGEASGSAIRLVTANTVQRRTWARISSGSYATQEIDLLAAGEWKRVGYLFSGSRFSTRGDFRYNTDNGTEHDPSDDRTLRWSNGDVRRHSILGKLNISLPAHFALEWSTQSTDSNQGVPGTSRKPTEAARMVTQDWLHRCEATFARGLDDLELRHALYGFSERLDEHYLDPLRELAVTGTPTEVQQQTARSGLGLHQRLQISTREFGQHSLEALVEVRREQLRREPPEDRPEEDRRRREARLLSVGDNWDAIGGALHASAFYRWETTRDNFSGSDPLRPFISQSEHQASSRGPNAGLRVALLRDLSLKLNGARQTRFPTFAELFGYYGAIAGNAALEPETGDRWDVGWLWSPEARNPRAAQCRIEQAFYESRMKQMIVFVLVSNRQTKPLNLDGARIRGCETNLTLDHVPLLRDCALLPAIETLSGRVVRAIFGRPSDTVADSARARTHSDAGLSAQVQWQDARDDGASPIYSGKRLTYHPEWRVRLQFDWSQGRWDLRYSANYRDEMYWARSNAGFVCDAQWQHDLALRCALHANRLVAAVRIENLTNDELEDVRGYPLPGRSWFTGLEARWP